MKSTLYIMYIVSISVLGMDRQLSYGNLSDAASISSEPLSDFSDEQGPASTQLWLHYQNQVRQFKLGGSVVSHTERFGAPERAVVVDVETLAPRGGKLAVGIMICSTDRYGWIDQELRKLIRGQSSSELRFTKLICGYDPAHSQTHLNLFLEYDEEGKGVSLISNDMRKKVLMSSPTLDELFTQMLTTMSRKISGKTVNERIRNQLAFDRYRQHRQFQTLYIQEGGAEQYKLSTRELPVRKPSNERGHYGRLGYQTPTTRFAIERVHLQPEAERKKASALAQTQAETIAAQQKRIALLLAKESRLATEVAAMKPRVNQAWYWRFLEQLTAD